MLGLPTGGKIKSRHECKIFHHCVLFLQHIFIAYFYSIITKKIPGRKGPGSESF